MITTAIKMLAEFYYEHGGCQDVPCLASPKRLSIPTETWSADMANFLQGVPAGVVNGINQVFTLPGVPAPGSLIVWQNEPLIPGAGYTLLGNTITFAVAPVSAPTPDRLYYQYWPGLGVLAPLPRRI